LSLDTQLTAFPLRVNETVLKKKEEKKCSKKKQKTFKIFLKNFFPSSKCQVEEKPVTI
jgi:hypothetical protein